ncbi:capping complex subunit for YIEGIA [Pelotomaculum propionicicum]|uniref:Uncharacterized protein n=1 Tax=Pelotomaculum propionicicum TaxID=258475 RepID=A0A4Y7RSU2_9FIRM|nr:hypothetical protein [Pelotomaculum propionicicum]NLI11899.1 hypothetical protein [Peptococcaceae bacterium]TEB11799.1 hypothetical protein Pmgp_01377 [Pelotomaculum propionicicum]
MNETASGIILAIVALDKEQVSGGAPIFFARDKVEQERTANYLARIFDAMAHDLENGSYILVRH